jgi:hypothetical protein
MSKVLRIAFVFLILGITNLTLARSSDIPTEKFWTGDFSLTSGPLICGPKLSFSLQSQELNQLQCPNNMAYTLVVQGEHRNTVNAINCGPMTFGGSIWGNKVTQNDLDKNWNSSETITMKVGFKDYSGLRFSNNPDTLISTGSKITYNSNDVTCIYVKN